MAATTSPAVMAARSKPDGWNLWPLTMGIEPYEGPYNVVGLFGDKQTVQIKQDPVIEQSIADLASKLTAAGAKVYTVMTENACKLILPKTFEALTGLPVFTTMWTQPQDFKIKHVDLAVTADIVVVAPATALSMTAFSCARAPTSAAMSAPSTCRWPSRWRLAVPSHPG